MPALGRLQTESADLTGRSVRPSSPRRVAAPQGLDSEKDGHQLCIGDTTSPTSARRLERKDTHMEYGIGGILILILVILAIVYFAKRV